MLINFSSFELNPIYGLLYIVAMLMALFVAMPFHEFAHAAAAKHEGDFTAVAMKRHTLALHKHFDLKGFLFLFFFGFGWARPVPVDERNYKRGRKSKFIVATAGIFTNLILGALFLFIYLFLIRFFPKVYEIKYYGFLLEMFLDLSISLNFMLAFFNLLPIYPLDGYKIVESFCKFENKFLEVMKRYSFVFMLILIFTGIYYYIFSYTGGLLLQYLTKLFVWILGL